MGAFETTGWPEAAEVACGKVDVETDKTKSEAERRDQNAEGMSKTLEVGTLALIGVYLPSLWPVKTVVTQGKRF